MLLALRITYGVPYLLLAELAVLESSTVLAHALDHKLLVFLAEAVRFHRGVRHPPDDEGAPEDGDDAVCHEKCLPRYDRTSRGYE